MHTKLCNIIKQLALIVSAAILLCTSISAYSPSDLIDYSNIMQQDINYGQYADGTPAYRNNVAVGSDATYNIWHFASSTEPDIYAQQDTLTKSLMYFYIPVYSSAANAYEYQLYIGSTSNGVCNQLDVVSVDTIYGGAATPASYAQQDDTNIFDQWQTADGGTTSYIYNRTLDINPKAAKVDMIRITFKPQSVFALTIIGLYNINIVGATADLDMLRSDVTNISNNISNMITEIQQTGDSIEQAVNNNTASTANKINQLVNATIKYGNDANYYLDVIAYSTDGQQLQIQTLQQHFGTALQAIQAQNQIIHNNVLSNAPTENQVNQVISKDQIAPDVDVSIIGGGSSNSGIGIIMSQTRVIAMLTCCVGIAILSYLLFGRKT